MQRRFYRIDHDEFERDDQMKSPAMSQSVHLMCNVCKLNAFRKNPTNVHIEVRSSVLVNFRTAYSVRPKLELTLEFQ